jgi:hypothetical protein
MGKTTDPTTTAAPSTAVVTSSRGRESGERVRTAVRFPDKRGGVEWTSELNEW